MECHLELRIWERHADRLLARDEGKTLGGIVRQIFLRADDPRIHEIGSLDRETGQGIVSYWAFHRRYEKREMEAAELLYLTIKKAFEPTGEECGTIYDTESACNLCGAGRVQRSDLRLDRGTIPRGANVVQTIAMDEWLVSDRLAESLKKERITGFELRPVWNCDGSRVINGWSQLLIMSKTIGFSPRTRFGTTPFDEATSDTGRCPRGDTIGPHLLSEVYVQCDAWDGSDFALSKEFVGRQSGGLIQPARLILVSQRVRRLMRSEKVKGWSVEVAHCSD